ncbi:MULTISPECIES: IucA/IucC family protein [Saccharibacillus]|uniref:IucA/IucC family protein n=1 Tax=Saccharibacillus TaxID=456492 RepID=UPI001239F958|nr:IucA/IucC family protein [Saccharibacillus sp. WB 17]MWJ33645.1 hypothetical protein [Saccharibacillus sp. WB 17]
MRETGQTDPFIDDPSLPGLSLAALLPATGQRIYGKLRHRSDAGHHEYGDRLYGIEIEAQPIDDWQPLAFEPVIERLLSEIAAAAQLGPNALDPGSADLKRRQLEEAIANSLYRMTAYLRHASPAGAPAALDFRRAEQSLLCGHPFHPTPKSLEGFSLSDSLAYSPEYGVDFALHGFAAAPELIAEDWLEAGGGDPDAAWVPAEMREAASRLLPPRGKSYRILPCHPWQARYLRSLDSVQRLLAAGDLVDLGPIGPRVVPTSSVRTVWNPTEQCFYKLSLHIRITNFIRENSEEQLLRTLDASRIAAAVQRENDSPRFGLLLETGYRTLSLPDAEAAEREPIMSGFSMIVREAPDLSDPSRSVPYVLASLLEVLPGEAEPLLFRAVRENRRSLGGPGSPDAPDAPGRDQPADQPAGRSGTESDRNDTSGWRDWIDWFRDYADVSIVPILRLYARFGISLEAHVQNSMLRLENGRPSALLVRDLEGISVDRTLAQSHGWIGTLVSADSPVLYSGEEALHRLKYYFFVNHLSHVVQRLAYYSGQAEHLFWAVVRQTLATLAEDPSDTRLRAVAHDLLASPTLPAKANLLSRFHQRGETPLYVDIPNPILPKKT